MSTEQPPKLTSQNERYVRLELIHKYDYKNVYLGIDRLRGAEIVWNQYNAPMNQQEADQVDQELDILEGIEHVNLIAFYDHFNVEDSVVCVTEKTSGSLKELLEVSRSSKFVVRCWCVEILTGLVYLHDMDIIHRDINLGNIFYKDDGRIKIGNLWLAKILNQTSTNTMTQSEARYVAPEQIDAGDYTKLIDVWAFGMCILGMITRRVPYFDFESDGVVWAKLSSGILPPELLRIADEEIVGFILCCLDTQDKRWSARKLLSHKFLLHNSEDDRQSYFEIRTKEDAKKIIEEYTDEKGYIDFIRSGQESNYDPDRVATFAQIACKPETEDEESVIPKEYKEGKRERARTRSRTRRGIKTSRTSGVIDNIDSENGIGMLQGETENNDDNPDTIDIKFSIAVPPSSTFEVEFQFNIINDDPTEIATAVVSQIEPLDSDHIEILAQFISQKVDEYKQTELDDELVELPTTKPDDKLTEHPSRPNLDEELVEPPTTELDDKLTERPPRPNLIPTQTERPQSEKLESALEKNLADFSQFYQSNT